MPLEKNNTSLDLLLMLRGILAISVVIWHGLLTNGTAPFYLSIPGRTAVWIFFGISGYVISYGFFSGRYRLAAVSIRQFYVNRLLRIFPLFLLLSLLAYISVYIVSGSAPISWQRIPQELLMLQFNHSYSLNSVFWTLGIECQFYLITPLLIFLFGYTQKMNFLLFCIAAYLLLQSWIPSGYFMHRLQLDSRNLIGNLSHFFAGMAACSWVINRKEIKLPLGLLAISALVLLIFTNYLYRYQMQWYWTIGSVCIDLVIVLAILLHSSFAEKKIAPDQYFLRFLSFSGLISYGIYAWHPFLSANIPLAENNVLFSLLFSFVAAAVSYRIIEKPALSLKRYA